MNSPPATHVATMCGAICSYSLQLCAQVDAASVAHVYVGRCLMTPQWEPMLWPGWCCLMTWGGAWAAGSTFMGVCLVDSALMQAHPLRGLCD